MFAITQSKGFHMTFENGYTISVQIGYSNYREGRDLGRKYRDETKEDMLQSNNAEIGAWDNKGNWLKLSESDNVRGWVSVTDVLAEMNRIAALPPV